VEDTTMQVDDLPAQELRTYRQLSLQHAPWFGAAVATLVIVSLVTFAHPAPRSAGNPGRGGMASAQAVAPSPSPSPTPSASRAIGALPTPTRRPAPLFRVGPVSVDADGFWSWSLLDRRTGKLSGSANRAATTTTASMIKPWIAADYLRRLHAGGAGPTPTRLAELSRMIRDSDNVVAETVFREIGQDASINRLVAICRLSDTSPYQGYWSNVRISARDTVRMGACLSDGRAAGSAWTGWLVNEMRNVRNGTFGIRPMLPDAVADRTAVKNGWLDRQSDHNWYINCMAIIGDQWVLAVLTRYPDTTLGMGHGVEICSSVTRQLLAD
jgi:hypothetical protein